MKFFTVFGALALVASATTAASAADWPRWRGPDLNGISQETGWQARWPAQGPKRLWTASVGTGFSSFSVSRGRVYTMGNTNDTDTVFCLDANSGRTVWKHSYPCALDPKNFEGGPAATPAVDTGGDRIYTFSRKGDRNAWMPPTAKWSGGRTSTADWAWKFRRGGLPARR